MRLRLLTFFFLIANSHAGFSQGVEVYQQYYEEGKKYLTEQNYGQAIASFNQAVEKMPYYSAIYQHRGEAKLSLKDYSGAIQDFNLAIQKKPSDIKSHRQRAKAYFQSSDYLSAIQDLEKVIAFSPEDQEAQSLLILSKKAQYQSELEQQKIEENRRFAIEDQRRSERAERRNLRNQIIWGSILPSLIWGSFFLFW